MNRATRQGCAVAGQGRVPLLPGHLGVREAAHSLLQVSTPTPSTTTSSSPIFGWRSPRWPRPRGPSCHGGRRSGGRWRRRGFGGRRRGELAGELGAERLLGAVVGQPGSPELVPDEEENEPAQEMRALPVPRTKRRITTTGGIVRWRVSCETTSVRLPFATERSIRMCGFGARVPACRFAGRSPRSNRNTGAGRASDPLHAFRGGVRRPMS